MKKHDAPTYEAPTITVVEFSLEDHIASSADYGPNLSCSEGIWGDSQ